MSDLIKTILNDYPPVRALAHRLLATVPLSRRLGRSFWEWLAFFEESERWSADQIRDYQFTQLRTLLGELKLRSPYYGQILRDVDPASIQTYADFQKQVPMLTRLECKKHEHEILATDARRRRLSKVSTSGTTGMALQFYHTAADQAREWAAICHQWKRVGYNPAKSVRAELRGLTNAKSHVEAFPEHNMIRCSILDLGERYVRSYADAMTKHRVEFFHGYPSALYLLAKGIVSTGIRFPQPQAILLASEPVYDFQLEFLEQVFPNSRLFAHYGCAERTVLGAWCEHRREYHVMPQYSLVEIDPHTSEVIGTNLFNSTCGFLRYRMTDTVLASSQETCPDCHRPYVPRLAQLGGRSEDYLFSVEHGWIPPAIVTFPLKALHVIREVQFNQKERGTIVVRYTVLRDEPSALVADIAHMKEGLTHIFGRATQFQWERVEDFARGATGKFKWILCDIEDMPSRGSSNSSSAPTQRP